MNFSKQTHWINMAVMSHIYLVSWNNCCERTQYNLVHKINPVLCRPKTLRLHFGKKTKHHISFYSAISWGQMNMVSAHKFCFITTRYFWNRIHTAALPYQKHPCRSNSTYWTQCFTLHLILLSPVTDWYQTSNFSKDV